VDDWKPALLMDVDGPLNPFEAPWFQHARAPRGYAFYELTPRDGRTYRLALNRSHGEQLRQLQDRFELVWATTWLHDANRLISPILGLPNDLAVIPQGRSAAQRGRTSWKVEQIADWAGPRPFAWFDDEINRATRQWLAGAGWLGSHLALRVPADRGLVDEDFDLLADFADSLCD
jgi:hypothetical protein